MADEGHEVGPVTGPYEYDYDILPPLAYAKGIHIEDLPKLRWVELVAEQLARILLDEVEADLEDDVERGLEDLVGRIVRWIEHLVSSLLRPGGGAALGDTRTEAPRSEVEDVLDALRAFGRSAHHPATVEEALSLVGRLSAVAQPARPDGDRTLKAYNDLFASLPLPDIAEHLHDDKFFAELRVAGFNPLMLRRVASRDDFVIGDEQFRAAPRFEHDSFEQAMQDGRLYVADYRLLTELQPGQNPAPKHVYAPVALFGVPARDRSRNPLAPIAIRVGQDQHHDELFGPGDGEAWEQAKTCVQSSDGNYHELVSHLGRTHLLIEPFVVATHRTLSADHPISKLLMPHFEGTIFINGLAVDFLVDRGGPVDRLLQGTIESDLRVTVKGVLDVGFDDSWLPTWMNDRGLDDREKLPYYPYRDDGMRVWNAIHDWCTGYVQTTYPTEQAMHDDEELAEWAREIVSDDGGRVKGFGGLGDREYLAGALTMLVFTASAAHAAVNFAQSSIMSYTPGVPLAGYEPAPGDGPPYEWIDMLPDLEMANLQLTVLYLLGGVHYTQLGVYETGHFTDKAIAELAAAFHDRLLAVEEEIAAANRARAEDGLLEYPYLLPSRIPQSINI